MDNKEYGVLDYLRDVIGRGGIAGNLGGPIDLADLVAQYVAPTEMRTLQGAKTLPAPRVTDAKGNPVGGSEYFGDMLEKYGVVSDQRNPVGELAASVLTPFAPSAARAAYAAVDTPQNLAALRRATDALGVPPTAATVSNVIKPKGGNWLSGSVEDALNRLKRNVDEPTISSLRNRLRQRLADMQLDPARVDTMDDVSVVRQASALPEYRNIPAGQFNVLDEGTGALNDWIDKQLTRYVKNEMATPEDPIRALAERGVLHYEPVESPGHLASLHDRRVAAGMPGESLGQRDLARAWEQKADRTVEPFALTEAKRAFYQHEPEGPWLQRAPLGTPLVRMSDGLPPDEVPEMLGFDHLIDELRNATNPDSGLPPELLLKYESLPRVSVPQAVERVAKINAWRAAQKAEANKALANNAATQVVKEYPDAGFRWVELRQKDELPEGWRNADNSYGGAGNYYIDPKGNSVYGHPNRKALEQALKYEGDTMGHCVGGYCDDVAEGRSRIFSLRDAKGQPHVTIEMQPRAHAISGDELMHLDPNLNWERDVVANNGHFDLWNWTKQNRPDLWDKLNTKRIVQIKGKQNRKPNPEYIPMVQDFVRTQGPWSDITDFKNAELARFLQPLNVRIGPQPFDVNPGYYSKQDLIDMAIKNGADPDAARIWAEGQGYADGGQVKTGDGPDDYWDDSFFPPPMRDPQFRNDVRQNAIGIAENATSKDWWLDTMSAPKEWLWQNLIEPGFKALADKPQEAAE